MLEMLEDSRRNILIIEDEEGPREALKQILQSKYQIFTSSNGSEAFDVLENHDIDLITVDIKIPGTPGHQLITDFKRLSPDSDVMIISGSGTLDSAIEGIRNGVSEFLTKPFGVMEVLASVERIFQKARKKINALPLQALPPNIDILQFARVLAYTLDGQDRYTHGHCERVAHLAVSIAEEFGFTPEECQDLLLASYLHDIGKVGIDRQIIRKEGVLSGSEVAILRSHPQRGLRVVAPLQLSQLARSVIRNHHECWDGSGYPDGLFGDQITLAARIVRVADAFDAMTSDRPYRLAFTKEKAFGELQQGKLTEFDPDVVDVFFSKQQVI